MVSRRSRAVPGPPPTPSLRQLAADLDAAIGRIAPSLTGDAAALLDRLSAGRFLLTVVGEFNRGKSTLINALIARDVLPMGAIPVTAVTTTLAHGPDGLVVHLDDGQSRPGSLDDLDQLVTETGNPGNRDGIARVEVTVPADLLAPGVTIIDTPGFASRHEHNTATAAEALARTDAAMLVLSALQPVSERDLALLDQLQEVSVRTLVVVNRIDDIPDADRGQVIGFVADTLADHGHEPERLYAISAADALAARLAGDSPAGEFGALLDALDDTLHAELHELRDRAARRQLRDLADRLTNTLEIEQAAAAMTTADLLQRLETFEQVLGEQRRRFDEDRAVIDRATTGIADAAYRQLLEAVKDPPDEDLERLHRAAEECQLRGLQQHLDALLEQLVRQRYDDLRHDIGGQVACQWEDAAGRFLRHVTARTDDLADAARDLFNVGLQPPQPPGFAQQPSGFYYDLTPSATLTGELAAPLRLLLPATAQRRRAVRRATDRYRNELTKHAGRVRWDVLQRLTAARNQLVHTTRQHLDQVAEDIQTAAMRAEQRRAEAVEQQQGWDANAEQARDVIRTIHASTAETEPNPSGGSVDHPAARAVGSPEGSLTANTAW
ncbi:MAG: hypothetical protein EA340_09950 [Nitriliruptor sp.]|nr:MAG: hypothetical protein EA340_09950 [Nitriliruptor sp.]